MRSIPFVSRNRAAAVEVNSISSFETELPYDYYSLPFCKPKGGIKKSTTSVNPGTILSGLHMFNSPYDFQVNVRPSQCLLICSSGTAHWQQNWACK